MQMPDKEKENAAIAQSDKEINCSSISSKRTDRERVQVLLTGKINVISCRASNTAAGKISSRTSIKF